MGTFYTIISYWGYFWVLALNKWLFHAKFGVRCNARLKITTSLKLLIQCIWRSDEWIIKFGFWQTKACPVKLIYWTKIAYSVNFIFHYLVILYCPVLNSDPDTRGLSQYKEAVLVASTCIGIPIIRPSSLYHGNPHTCTWKDLMQVCRHFYDFISWTRHWYKHLSSEGIQTHNKGLPRDLAQIWTVYD